MTVPDPPPAYEPTGFFVLRSPLLPEEEHEAWSAGLEVPGTEPGDGLAEALKADRVRLRTRLAGLLDRPEVEEALFLASPSLHKASTAWRRHPEGASALRAERSLVRYFLRMAARPTPFGLFAGCSTGLVDRGREAPGRTRLRLAPRRSYRRATRLDMDYLVSLAGAMVRSNDVRNALRYSPASSLYRAGGALRYVEVTSESGNRRHRLVEVRPSEALTRVLDRARRDPSGTTLDELAGALVEADPEGDLPREEAERFVLELISAQILDGGFEPNVTGLPPVGELVERLHAMGDASGHAASTLSRVADDLRSLDRGGLGASPRRYRRIARDLQGLSVPLDPARWIQVDLVKPADRAVLSPAVIDALRDGIETLRLLAPTGIEDPLAGFRREFLGRYGEGRRVPLTEALDDEVGIGFAAAPTTDPAPLLDGLGLTPLQAEPRLPWGQRESLLLAKLEEALRDRSTEAVISDRDLEPFRSRPAPTLPNAFQATLRIAAADAEALDGGRFRILLEGVHGPSGARLLGRFSGADPELERWTRKHLADEEALEPDTLFAEVVHLPEGRIGNVILRPILRGFEIPYLGRSGAPADRRIPVSDLALSIENGRLALRSIHHGGRRVAPRMTTAHNYLKGLPLYRFLCALQAEGVRESLSWWWGGLESARFLPRIRRGRAVLARARWSLPGRELRELARRAGDDRITGVRAWRERHRVPRRVVLVEADHELPVDLENVLELDAFLDQVRRSRRVQLTELFPPPGELPARGPEGRFHHQVLVPFVRSCPAVKMPAIAPRPVPPPRPAGPRRFAPGSEWLYARLYAGPAACDRILVETVAPLVRRLASAGALESWFFVRYGDPAWHLRLRLTGRPNRLRDEVRPALEGAASALLAEGTAWKLQLDTYEREVERFGGDRGIELAERLFAIDSDAVLAILGSTPRDLRWRAALVGCRRLLEDLAIAPDRAMEIVGELKDSFARELAVDPTIRRRMADRLRREQDGGTDLLALREPAAPLVGAAAALGHRSRRMAPVAAQLHRRAEAGELTRPVDGIAQVLVHLHTNRIFRSRGRAQEAVLYDFLHRLLLSRTARARHEAIERAGRRRRRSRSTGEAG